MFISTTAKDQTCQYGSRRLTYVPTLRHEDTDEEKSKKKPSSDPSISGVGRTFVEIGLVYLVEGVPLASLDGNSSYNMTYSS